MTKSIVLIAFFLLILHDGAFANNDARLRHISSDERYKKKSVKIDSQSKSNKMPDLFPTLRLTKSRKYQFRKPNNITQCPSKNVSYPNSERLGDHLTVGINLFPIINTHKHPCDDVSRSSQSNFLSTCSKITQIRFQNGSNVELFACILHQNHTYSHTVLNFLQTESNRIIGSDSIIGRVELHKSKRVSKSEDFNDDIYSVPTPANPWQLTVPIDFDRGPIASLQRHTCYSGLLTIHDPGLYEVSVKLEFTNFSWFADNVANLMPPLMQELPFRSLNTKVGADRPLLIDISSLSSTVEQIDPPVDLSTGTRRTVELQDFYIVHGKSSMPPSLTLPVCTNGNEPGRWLNGVWQPYACHYRCIECFLKSR